MFKITPKISQIKNPVKPQSISKGAEPLRIKKPIELRDGRILFIKDGVSYERSTLADGRTRLVNLDTGDEVIGMSLAH